jgi:toxin ParE1/3/4
MKVLYRERALTDLQEIAEYIYPHSRMGVRNVLAAIHKAIESIAEQPLSARQTSDAAVRLKIVGRYGYKIFYSVSGDAIEILHVRHGSRRPWFLEHNGEEGL